MKPNQLAMENTANKDRVITVLVNGESKSKYFKSYN